MLMFRALLEIFLLRRFPKLTLLGLGIAALIGVMRSRRAH
jgi:hypothetical protein